MPKKRVPIEIPPGVVRPASNASVSGRWYEAHLCRWNEGNLRPVLGWNKRLTDFSFASTPRAVHAWTDNSGVLRTAVLCSGHVYIINGNGVTNISPVTPLASPSSSLVAGGYGDDEYGEMEYGNARGDRIDVSREVGPAFTLGNWGEDLLVMSSVDGRLLRWRPSVVSDVCTPVTGAPTGRIFAVTPERHVIVFGANSVPADWKWCSQEDIEDWTPTTVNTAGGYTVEPAAEFVGVKATRFGTVAFTTAGPYFIRYIGTPFIYSRAEKMADGAVPLSAQAILVYSDRVYWPSEGSFWVFDGNTVMPIQCPLMDWLRNNWNPQYLRHRTSGTYLGMGSELWWFFPMGGGTENSYVLIFDTVDKWWSEANIPRNCGCPAVNGAYPVMLDGSSVYDHEQGFFYPDVAELPYAKSAAMNLEGGASNITLMQVIVDNACPVRAVAYDFEGVLHRVPGGIPAPVSKIGVQAREDGYMDVMLSGRDITVKVKAVLDGYNWTFGVPLAEIALRGKR